MKANSKEGRLDIRLFLPLLAGGLGLVAALVAPIYTGTFLSHRAGALAAIFDLVALVLFGLKVPMDFFLRLAWVASLGLLIIVCFNEVQYW